MKDRIGYFDIARGIGIISVIIGHSITGIFRDFIFSFHIPLFFLISGFFFRERNSNELVKKNARHLLLPYLFTCFCIIIWAVSKNLLLHNYPEMIHQLKLWTYASVYGAGTNHQNPFYIKQIGAIWFLLALFVGEYCVNKVLRNKYAFAWIAIFAYVSYETGKFIWLPFSIQPGLIATVFIYIGYIIKEYRVLEKKLPFSLIIGMFVLWGLCIKYGGLSMVRNYYKNGLLDGLGALCGVYFIVNAAMLIERKWRNISKGLIILGQNTLVILCFHLIEMTIVPWRDVLKLCQGYGIDKYASVLIILAMKFLWMICAILIVKKVPLLRKIFYTTQAGGRSAI